MQGLSRLTYGAAASHASRTRRSAGASQLLTEPVQAHNGLTSTIVEVIASVSTQDSDQVEERAWQSAARFW
jgi:hypothetical protein